AALTDLLNFRFRTRLRRRITIERLARESAGHERPGRRGRDEANGPTVRRVLSRSRVFQQRPLRRPSIYDVRCRTPLAVYPETGRAARNASCLTLLRARFTQPARSLGLLVVSYTTVSPLPRDADFRRRLVAVCFLLHFLADCSGWVLPTALLYGARTFLGASRRRQRDRLVDPFAALRLLESDGPLLVPGRSTHE
ncbi:MAG: hypothetical protein QOI14_137, partial [Actinomycetota bacterium]|nr:hypothetical protein [Actinomycetota bacterium]